MSCYPADRCSPFLTLRLSFTPRTYKFFGGGLYAKEYLALNFAYNHTNSSLHLNHKLHLDLTQALADPNDALWNQSFPNSHIATGELDGINMPWFNKADACLLFSELHGAETEITVHLQRKSNSSPYRVFVYMLASMTQPHSTASAANHASSKGQIPLLIMGFDLSSDNGSVTRPPSFQFPTSFSTSPSSTYAVRRALQTVLSRAFYIAAAAATIAWIAFRLLAAVGLVFVCVWLGRQYRNGQSSEIGHAGKTPQELESNISNGSAITSPDEHK